MNFCTKLVESQHIQLNWEITHSQEAEMDVSFYFCSGGSAKREKGNLLCSKDKISWKFVLLAKFDLHILN